MSSLKNPVVVAVTRKAFVNASIKAAAASNST